MAAASPVSQHYAKCEKKMAELAARIDDFRCWSSCTSASHRAWLLVSVCLAHRLGYDMVLIPFEGEAAVYYRRACDLVRTTGHACVSRGTVRTEASSLVEAPVRF